MLADGTYDTLVIDADDVDGGGIRLELTVVAGPYKGEVVAVRAATSRLGSAIDLMGLPATLTVTDGRPHVDLSP